MFERERHQAKLLGPQPRIFAAVRHAEQAPVAAIAPRMIGAGQDLGAAAGAIDQSRAAVAADVGEGARLAVVAANDDHALAEIFQSAPLAGRGDIALVADDLWRSAQERLFLCLEEFRV